MIYDNVRFMQELKAKKRAELGKKVKVLRGAGFIPAVLYGENTPSQPISVSFREFNKVFEETGESSLLKLEVDDKVHNVLIYDVLYDPIKGIPLHADFYAVRMDRIIRSDVPLEFYGESPAVKNEGGVFVRVRQELEVEALPQDLPKELRVDVSQLDTVGSRILIKDILAPEGVKILADFDEVIALVEAARSEEELAALEQALEEPLAEVKTEKEVKDEATKKEKEEAEAKEDAEKK